MILLHKNLDIHENKLSFKKIINLNNELSFIPIQYNTNDILIQTPNLLIPFKMNIYSEKSNKKYLNLSFLVMRILPQK